MTHLQETQNLFRVQFPYCMKKYLASIFVIVCIWNISSLKARISFPQQDSATATLSGFIKDSASGETIIGARVRIRALKIGSVTNKSGFFTLHVPSGEKLLVEVYSVGYRTLSEQMTFSQDEDRRITFWLHTEAVKGGET